MSTIQEIIDTIEQQKIGALSRQVLVVEGKDDLHAIEIFLNKKFPNWTSKWVIGAAGGKNNVIKILAKKTDWFGIIDPDEWSKDTLEQKKVEHENLLFLPRYCLENYLIFPNELWNSIPDKKKKKTGIGLDDLEEQITLDLDKWVRHGVLWSVVNPLREGLKVLGFKDDLLEPKIAKNNRLIKEKLEAWHDYLDPERLYSDYQSQLAIVQKLPVNDQLRHWVHGKKFFPQVVNQVLNNLLGQQLADDRKIDLFRTCPVPEDLKPLWEKMGLVPEGVN